MYCYINLRQILYFNTNKSLYKHSAKILQTDKHLISGMKQNGTESTLKNISYQRVIN